MLSPDVLASKYVPMLPGFKRVNLRDWVWEQEGKRTETKPLNQALCFYSWAGFEHLLL